MTIHKELEQAFEEKFPKLKGIGLGSYRGEAAIWAAKWMAERCAKVAEERKALMNRLGSDKDMKRTMTHAEIQAQRVLEAWEILNQIRQLASEIVEIKP